MSDGLAITARGAGRPQTMARTIAAMHHGPAERIHHQIRSALVFTLPILQKARVHAKASISGRKPAHAPAAALARSEWREGRSAARVAIATTTPVSKPAAAHAASGAEQRTSKSAAN